MPTGDTLQVVKLSTCPCAPRTMSYIHCSTRRVAKQYYLFGGASGLRECGPDRTLQSPPNIKRCSGVELALNQLSVATEEGCPDLGDDQNF